jgi:hypothetical protein
MQRGLNPGAAARGGGAVSGPWFSPEIFHLTPLDARNDWWLNDGSQTIRILPLPGIRSDRLSHLTIVLSTFSSRHMFTGVLNWLK